MHESDFFVLQNIKLVKNDLGLTIKVPKVTRVSGVPKVASNILNFKLFNISTLSTPNFRHSELIFL